MILRIRSRIGLLRKGKNLLTKHAKKVLYYAQIHSIFQYGIVIWGPLISRTVMNKMQKLQNKCVQLIDPNAKLSRIYEAHNIPKLLQMVQIECCKLWQRHHLKLLPVKLAEIMSKDNKQHSLKKKHRYGTRNKHVLYTPLATNLLYRNSFFVKGLTMYQKITNSTRSLKDIKIFTKTLKRDLIFK